LASLAKMLNRISKNYLDTETMFDFADLGTGAVALLYLLDDGLKAEQARQERFKTQG